MSTYVALSQLLCQRAPLARLPARRTFREWYPSLAHPNPPGVNGLASMGFFVINQFGLFSTPDYCAVSILEGDHIIHRSVIFPKDPRIGFMGLHDLQVGNIYTEPGVRRQGLALKAIDCIREKFAGRRLWYFADAGNSASLELAKTAGFKPEGIFTVTRFLGFGFRYSALTACPPSQVNFP